MSNTYEVRVPDISGLQIGDVILEFTGGTGNVNDRRASDARWTVTTTSADCVSGRTLDGRVKVLHDTASNILVERAAPATQPLPPGKWVQIGPNMWMKADPERHAAIPWTVHKPATNAISDWPHDCPRCGRAESAYLGLNAYDCKHGCFARGKS